MPAVCRTGDSLLTGHICAGITQLDTPSQSKVFANGILIARKNDKTVSHAFPPAPVCAPHVAQVNAGSPTVFVAGRECARIADLADAGVMIEGSSNVFAGGETGEIGVISEPLAQSLVDLFGAEGERELPEILQQTFERAKEVLEEVEEEMA